MTRVANLLHRIAYRLAPQSYTVCESNHHGRHRLTITAGGNRFVCNYGPQHPEQDCD